MQAGVKHVILTLGPQGASLCHLSACHSRMHITHMPALPAVVTNTSGAGDCLVAGAAMRLLQGGDASSALAHGLVRKTPKALSFADVALAAE